MEQIYVIMKDRLKEGGDEVTWEELKERCSRIDGSMRLKQEIQGVYDTAPAEPELIAVPKEFVVQE